MIHLLGKIPNKVYLALSGGPDSIAALDFLLSGKKDVTAVYFYHNTPHGLEAMDFVEKYAHLRRVPLLIERISRLRHSDESEEEYWRNERYAFLESLDGPVITAHHLDDVVEWWLFTSLHGNPRVIPYQRNNVIRPFLMTPKSVLIDWCHRRQLPFIIDPGNFDEKHMRSIIRHKILPEALRVNPGLRTVLKKKVSKSVNLDEIE